MSVTQDPTAIFNAALSKYLRAKARLGKILSEAQREAALKRLDLALEAFVESPSPCFDCFHRKIEILKLEYGVDAQPRHFAAIYSDVGGIAALSAG